MSLGRTFPSRPGTSVYPAGSFTLYRGRGAFRFFPPPAIVVVGIEMTAATSGRAPRFAGSVSRVVSTTHYGTPTHGFACSVASAAAPALVAPAPAMLELAPRGGCLTLLCCAAAASSDVQLVPNGAITPDSATYITLVEVEQPTKAATSIVRPNTIETGGVITVASAVFASTVAPGCTPANPICSSADACCQPTMASESDWSQHRRNLRAAHAAADAMTPADKMPPAPADAIAPANADAIALANADAMTSANADAMTSANADAMTPANVEPASFSVRYSAPPFGRAR